MPLQKAVHFFGQFWPDALGRRNLLDARFAQAIDRTEFSLKQAFPVLTHTRAIVENTFVDPFLKQQLWISVGEAVRFIADSLKEMQRSEVCRQLQRQRPTRPGHLLLLFRHPDDVQSWRA